ncbi:hypothetical protein I6A84_24085 [Frankia sp. CNm7]|uniref:Uncharacterized protein n=1 Tax=Frankia nepalensis TaxID=1836974 RepID=A0A937UT64_9ACTN|nr:hypothetical protein [Frankia nepalensis]MBL7495836.1 hypothetical protein [Frankia nepalensis]MBL7509912.1 hypothetical protein [Frankia nepalensis]MBL7521084.1 hypothetical protein [Frankia nepalensis]MBL7629671.1 hypothetical protein [Frankia nepalensis]
MSAGLIDLPPFVITAEIRGRLKHALKRFSAPSGDGAEGSAVRLGLDPPDFPPSQIVHYMLATVMGYPHLGQAQRTAWIIDMRFENRPLAIASENFEIRAYLTFAEGDSADLGLLSDTLLNDLQKGVRVLEKTSRGCILAAVGDSP